MVTVQNPWPFRRRSRLVGARSSSMMCHQSYTAMFSYASLLFLAPLCHAFVTPSTSNALHFRNDCGAIRNMQQYTHKGCRSSKPAVPRMTATSEFGGIQHAGVIVSDTKASKDFYVKVLGFEDDSPLRPDDKLPFDGAFVRAGPTQIHLMELPNPDPVDGRPEHGGRDRHVAFTIQDLGPLKGRLDGAGVTYTMSKSGRAALFCRDLDGNAFEFIQQAV